MTLRLRADKSGPIQSVIETSRLSLRPITPDDAKSIFPAFTPEITKFMIPKSPREIADTETWVSAAIAADSAGTDFHWIIRRLESGDFLGVCGLHCRGDSDSPELGIWLAKQAQGSGFGHEAIAAVVAWVPANITCSNLSYPVDRRNIPSRKIPERLGGEVFGEKKVENMAGLLLDLVIYRIPIAAGVL